MKTPSPISGGGGGHRKGYYSSYLITLSFIFFVTFLYGEDFACILQQPFRQENNKLMDDPLQSPPEQERAEEAARAAAFAVGSTETGCDLFEGSWVYDEAGRPQYEEEECPYIQPQLTCQNHGRPDRRYQHWRWQPRRCSLPTFNATLVLESIRGKRMMYVGDSLNRGQFVSMICLLHRLIPDAAKKSFNTIDNLSVFKAEDYNATVEFYWAPFLVESNSDNAIVHRVTDRIVRAGSIKKHAKHWKGADIMVFNTYLWWMTGMKMKILRGSFEGEMKNITEVVTEDAYGMALKRMVRWVEKNMDPNKTRVFFMTMSPSHEKGHEWGGEWGSNCYNQTSPIDDPGYWGTSSSRSMMEVIRRVVGSSSPSSATRSSRKMVSASTITVVNITQLSEYRKDAHTSIYKKQWNPPTAEQIANPRSYSDCVHWCLPGLQDTWNELLYAKLFFP